MHTRVNQTFAKRAGAKVTLLFLLASLFGGMSFSASAVPLLISISNAPGAVTANAVGDTQFWPQAGTLGPGGTPISLRATVTSISAGDSIRLFTSGDNPVVRANTGSLSATVLWEVFDRNTGLPIVGDPDFLITDIDGRNGNPIESVSAACSGLTSYTVNGDFLAGCNANNNNACDTNIRVTTVGGEILGEGTQNQSNGQQEGYMQYSWTGVSSWVVSYFATSGGRWYVHDADGDIPFDATATFVNVVDMATIKGLAPGSLTSPAENEQITFQIEMSNIGPANATNGNLTDLLPAGLQYLSHTVTAGNYNFGTGLWSGVDVAVNEVQTLTITALVTASAGTSLTNTTSTALADENLCSSRDEVSYTFVVAETPAPELSIVKSIDPVTSFAKAGDTITYRYEVSNDGNVNIDSVVPVDAGPTFGVANGTNMLGPFMPNSATIAPGDSQIYTATYVLSQDDVDNMAVDLNPLTAIDNTATATGVPTGGMLPVVPASTAETGFAPAPSLTVTKSIGAATTFAKAGDTITYEYVVQNTGNISIESVVPTDAGPTFNGAPATNTLSAFSPANVTLAPNASQTFTATYILDQIDVDNMAAAADPLTAIDNTASADGDPIGATALPAVPSSMVETGFALTPSLTIAKSVSTATTFSKAGDTITYEYVVENTGNVTINNVVPTDSGPTFNAMPATNSLSAFSPASVSLPPAGMQIFTATYVLSQEDVDNLSASTTPATAIDNTASATGTPIGGTLAAVTPSMAETGFTVVSGLTLTKTVTTPTTGLGLNTTATDGGDTIAYSFEVTNSGGVTISSLLVNDTGPTFNGMAASGTLSAINCGLTSLLPGQSTTCSATYTLSQGDVDNALIGGANAVSNTANASGLDPNGGTVTSSDQSAMTTIVADSSADVNKAAEAPTVAAGADATIVDPGDTIDYTISVENTGNSTLSNVTISDTIVTPVCPASTTLGNAFVNDGTGILAVGDSITCTATYTLLQTDLDNGGVMNTATLNSTDPTGAPVTASDMVSSGFTQKASVSLVKSATPLPMNPVVGDIITYSFELTNTGNVSLSNAQVSDPICQVPVGPLTFTNGYTSGDMGVAGELEAGETWTFNCDYAITLPDINLGEVANTATGTGTPPASSMLPAPTSTASNLAEAQQNAAIALDKTASLATVTGGSLPAATDAGDTISYSFIVENTGNVTLTNVSVTDPLITGAPNNGTISCGAGIASMDPGDTVTCTATYTLILTDINAGMRGNTATATGTPPVSVPPLDAPVAMSAAVVNIAPLPELSVSKTVDALPSPFQAGSTTTYNYLIQNNGNVSITGVSPVDTGPTFNGVAGENALSAFSPLNANLDPGLSQMFSATYIVTQTDVDNMAAAADPTTAIDNEATADGAPSFGSLPPVTPSTVETGVVIVPAMELIKSSVAPTPALVDSDITYTFALENTGLLTISSPSISDTQCATPGSILSFSSGYVSGDTGAIAQALEPGETWTFSCTYPLTQTDIDAGTVQNTAIASGQSPSGGAVEDTSDSSNPGDDTGATDDPTNTPLVQTPMWVVMKSTSSIPTAANDTLVYEFELDNTGNVSISNVMLADAKCAAAPSLIGGDLDNNMILAPSETWTYQCTSIGVTQTEVDLGMVDNSVSVTGTSPTGAPTLMPATDMESTPIAPMPGLSVVKSSTPPTLGFGDLSSATDAGDMISYSFAVSNDGNVTISALQVNDTGPTFGGTAGAGTWSGVSCPVASLLPMQSTTCSATYTLDQADIDAAIAAGADSVANSATAQGAEPDASVVTSSPSESVESITSAPALEVVKTAEAPTILGGADPALTDPGDTILFNIVVENTGNTTLSSVLVSDNLAAVTCLPTASPSGAPFVNDGSGSLAVGDTATCSATYSIIQDDINAGQVVNTASVMSQDPSGMDVNGVSEATSPFTQKTSVSLAKSITTLPNNPAILNDVIVYGFTLENTGNVSLSDAQIEDLKCDSPATILTRTVGYVSGDTNMDNILDADEAWTFSCSHTVISTDIDAGAVVNGATGMGTPPAASGLPNPSSESGSIAELGQETGITLDKVGAMPSISGGTLAGLTDVGDTITYTLSIENTGNVTLTDIVLDDPLITGAPNNGVFSCTRDIAVPVPFDITSDSLAADDKIICTADYVLTQADIDAASVSNSATISGTPPPTIPPGVSPMAGSSAMVPVPPAPTLTIDKSASAIPAVLVAGTVITYSFDIENTGNVTIDNVTPVDLGPTFNGVAGTNALSAFSPISTTLAPGTSQVFTATYAVSQADLDNMAQALDPLTAIDNEATAIGEPAVGVLGAVTPDTVETGLATDPELTLVKSSVTPTVITAGALVTYNFTLENTGNVTVSNPIVTDAMCQTPGSVLSFSSGYVSGDTGTIAESLDVGETWLFSCTYALTQTDIDSGTIQNTAIGSGQDPSGDPVSDMSDSSNTGDDTGADNDPTNTLLTRAPSWTIDKSTMSVPTMEGDTLLYQFVVDNTGNVSISSVVVADTKCDIGPALTAGDTDNNMILDPLEVWTYECTSFGVTQPEVDAGKVDNSVSVSGTPPAGSPALPNAVDMISTPIAASPNLSIAKSIGTATIFNKVGDTITYEYLVENTGNVTINNVVPTDVGPTFNGIAGTNALSAFMPSSVSLAPTATQLFTATYVLSQDDVDNLFTSTTPATAIDNTASVSGSPVGGILPFITPSTVETGFPIVAGLSITKTADAPTVGFGINTVATDADDTIVYNFEVSNSGGVTISSIAVNDTGPTFNGVAGSGTLSAISCGLSNLLPTQSTTCTATYTLSQSDVDNALIGGADAVSNTADATGLDPNAATVTSPDQSAMTTIAADSSASVSKAAGAPTVAAGSDASIVDPGDTISYSITTKNTGNSTLSNVLIADTITTPVCPATTVLGNAFVNDGNSTLAVGDSIVCSATYTLLQTDLDNGGVQNTASVTSTDPTGAPVTASDTVDSGFTQKTSVSLVKSATPLPAVPVVGNLITYTFELTNTGNVSLAAAQVSDPICQIPVGPLTFTNGYVSGDTGAVGELEAGETWIFECDYAITQPDINLGEIANVATGTGTPPAGSMLPAPTSTASNLADAQQNAAIALDKTASLATVAGGSLPSATDVGDTIAYSFVVENTGNVTLTNVVVTDPLITDPPNSGAITCEAGIASMGPGAEVICMASYTLTLPDMNAGMVGNTAMATGTPPASVPPLDAPIAESSAVVNITPLPELNVTKTVDALPNPFMQGSTITYNYLIENSGNVSISGVSPVDAGPTFNGVAGSNALSAFSPASADLDPGLSQAFTATYVVSQTDLDNMAAAADPTTAVDNEATALGTPTLGSLPPVAPSSIETGVVIVPEMELTKTSVAPTPALVGSDITYTFSLENTGLLTISSPAVNDAQCVAPGSVLSFASGYVSGDTGTTAQALDPGETWMFSCTYPLEQADIDAGTVQNTAIASGQSPSGSSVDDTSDSGNAGDDTGADDDPTNTPLAQTPSWMVTKSTSSTPSAANETLLYEFLVDNLGNVSISNVMVNDAKCAAAPSLIGGDLDNNMILAPTEMWTYQCTSIGVTQGEVDSGMVDNSVSVTGTPPAGSPTLPPATDMESTPITPMPLLSIVKSSTPATLGLGDIASATDEGDLISYSFEVVNDGNVTIDALQVNDTGPTFGGAAGAGTWSGATCPVTTLLPMQSTTCSATYTLAQADIDAAIAAGADSVANSATAQGTDPDSGVVTSPASGTMQSIASAPELEINKSAGAPTIAAGTDPALTDPGGDTVPFTIVVENTGNTTLSSVLVSDNLASVSCLATASPSGLPFVNDGSGSLAVGDTATCSATYPITQDDINAGQVINTASVSSQDPTGAAVSGTDQATSGFTQKTSIALVKAGSMLPPAPVAGVSVLTYTFSLTNTGNVSLSGAQVDDAKCQAPSGLLTISNGFTGGDANANTLLDAGETWTFSCDYTLTQDDINLGEVANTAIGTGTPPAPSGLPAPSSTSSALADAGQVAAISLDKIASMPTQMNGMNSQSGDTVSYTFKVENLGNVTLTNVALTDPTITDLPNSGTISCVRDVPIMPQPVFNPAADALIPGDALICTADYTLTQPDIDSGTINNTANIVADPPVSVPPVDKPEGSSSAMTPIAPDPRLSVDKSASVIPSAVVEGTMITYTFVIMNTGNVTINNVVPVDSGPSFNGVVGTNSLSAFTPLSANLAPGEMRSFSATYEISQVDLDNMAAAADPTVAISNEASATGAPVNGSLVPVVPDQVETGVAASPSMLLTKSSTPPAIVAAGALVRYDFVLQNTGNVTISNPLINDTKCQIPSSTLTFNSGYVSGDTGVNAQALDVTETWNFSCNYALTQADIDSGTVQNTATAEGQDPAGNPVVSVSDSTNPGDDTGAVDDPTNTPLTRTPDWNVVKSTASMPMSLGETLEYEFLITNTGNVSIMGVMVTDAKCQPGTIVLDATTDRDGDNVISPAGAANVPPAEQWLYRCTSVGITQAEMDVARVDNDVLISGSVTGAVLDDEVDDIMTPIATNPELSLVKSAGIAVLNADGTFDQVFNFVLKNTGNITLNAVQIVDDIPTQFGSCFDSTLSPGTISLMDVAPTLDSTAPAAGVTPAIATSATLSVGDSIAVDNYILRFNPNAAGCVMPTPVQNTATASATPSTGGSVSDVSDSGTDPDAGNPNDTGTPTQFTPPSYMPLLGSAKTAAVPVANADGTFDVQYTILLENTGNVDITDLSLEDDLVSQFGSAFSASSAANPTAGVLVAPAVTMVLDANTLNLVLPNTSASFDGSAGSNMFDGSSGYLGVGDRIQVTFAVRVDPNAPAAPTSFLNTATVSGEDPSGTRTSDNTNDGSDPSIGIGGPGSPTQVLPPILMPALEIVKAGTLNANGSIDYVFTITNTGNVNLTDVVVTDLIISNFVYAPADDADGDSDIDLLVPGQIATVSANYELSAADLTAGSVSNTATVTGIDPSSNPVEDVSDSANPADDTGADDDPTVTPFDPPSLGVAKDLIAGSPVDLGNGSFQVSYAFVISNTGPFDLNDLQLVDDLNQMINNPNPNNGTFASAVVTSSNGTLTPSASYDGSADTNLLAGSDILVAGATGLIELSFVFTPDVYFGPFFNQATLMATDPAGNRLSDLSEDGSTVNTDSESLTPFQIVTPSTPINLGWFRSSEQPDESVLFEWTSEVEVSNAGFYIAVQDTDGYWHRVNANMIPSKGDSTSSQSYQYIARNLKGVRFMLTDVSVLGSQVDHGPFELGQEYGVDAERKSTDWEAIRKESERKAEQREHQRRQQLKQRMRQQSNIQSSARNPVQERGIGRMLSRVVGGVLSALIAPVNATELINFEVEQAGLYRVTHSQLLASGLDLSGIDISRIGLKQANQAWPLKVYPAGQPFGSNSRIIFPGKGLNTLYTGKNTYTLVLDEGEPKVIQLDEAPIPERTAPAQSYLAEKSYAPQNHYTHLSPSEDDSWYADSLRAIQGSANKGVNLNVTDYAPAINRSFAGNGIARSVTPRARLEVELWGNSNLPGNGLTDPDHHVFVDLNGQRVSDVRFDGLHQHKIETVLSDINYGNNLVRVTVPKDHGYQFDLINLNRITLRYPRLFKAERSGKSLVFNSDWSYFKVNGLESENVTVLRLDSNGNAYEMMTRGQGHCSAGCAYFAGSAAGQSDDYFLATNRGFRKPKMSLPIDTEDILDGEARALIISHPDFIQTSGQDLQAYASELANQYGSVDIVDTDAIYAQYSGHVFDADAIHRYIKQAYQERNTRHVILVGGDVYDYHNNLQNGSKSFVPSLYVKIATNVNAVPSDAAYADVDGDYVPDMTITRLPVRSSAELATILSKRQQYLARTYQDVALFSADKIDGSGYSFKADSQAAISQYFDGWDVQKVYLDEVNIATGKQSLIEGLNQGASLTSYFGHSSTDRWSIFGLFTGDDVSDLSNSNNPTVVAQWGCWNTFYVSPDQDSLAHRFLVDGAHGAVTVMGASSFTKADAERRMAYHLYQRLNQGMTIAAAVLSAKQAIAQETPHQLDVLLGWTVLGLDDFSVFQN